MSVGLAKLAEEDPTFQVRTNHETGQTIIAGMGELHLEIIVDRLRREFKVEANVGKPQVAYRETVRHEAVMHAEGKFVRQSGGRGQYGHAIIDMEPNEEGKGYEFENAIVGGVIPKEYIPSIDKGIQEALETGVIAGYPVVDIKVTLIDGSYHEVDSSEAAFKIAGSMAIKEALRKSDPILLEPVDGRRGRDPRAVHGRRHGQPLRPPRQDRGHGGPLAAPRSSAPRCRWARCSATPPTSVRRRRAARATPCSSTPTSPRPKNIRDEVVAKNGGTRRFVKGQRPRASLIWR